MLFEAILSIFGLGGGSDEPAQPPVNTATLSSESNLALESMVPEVEQLDELEAYDEEEEMLVLI